MPSNKTIIGVAILLFGSVLLGVGIHHIVKTGTCSSTGYSANYGPVPYCPKGTGWWILFLIGGIFLAIIGGFVTMGSGAALIVPAIFTAIGVGSLTVAFEPHVSSGTKTFSLIFGGAFALFGVIPALFVIVGALKKLAGSGGRASAPPARAGGARKPGRFVSPFGGEAAKPDAIMGAYAAGTPTASTTAPSASVIPPSTMFSPPTVFATPPTTSSTAGQPSREDPLDKIAKLAELRKSGALTEDEFNREKAKLLGEV